jgi:hypothetical protein
MLTVVLKAVKMLMSCCPNKNNQDVIVLTALKAVQDTEKKITSTKIKYKDLFPSKTGPENE